MLRTLLKPRDQVSREELLAAPAALLEEQPPPPGDSAWPDWAAALAQLRAVLFPPPVMARGAPTAAASLDVSELG